MFNPKIKPISGRYHEHDIVAVKHWLKCSHSRAMELSILSRGIYYQFEKQILFLKPLGLQSGASSNETKGEGC